mmetsp:Transcript_73800/g.227927  ORF Transcript_73800/g.227927 Transcript_73800/m.227927 type:complete len:218 (-) Transcript_73800:86-739(-)
MDLQGLLLLEILLALTVDGVKDLRLELLGEDVVLLVEPLAPQQVHAVGVLHLGGCHGLGRRLLRGCGRGCGHEANHHGHRKRQQASLGHLFGDGRAGAVLRRVRRMAGVFPGRFGWQGRSHHLCRRHAADLHLGELLVELVLEVGKGVPQERCTADGRGGPRLGRLGRAAPGQHGHALGRRCLCYGEKEQAREERRPRGMEGAGRRRQSHGEFLRGK